MIWKDPRGTVMEVRRVDLANWAFQTSSKFATGVIGLLRVIFNRTWMNYRKNYKDISIYCIHLTEISIFISSLPSSEFYARGQSFTANSGSKSAVLLKCRSSTANSGTKVVVLLGMNRCGSFPLHLASWALPYYLVNTKFFICSFKKNMLKNIVIGLLI